jgi:epoxyqueuosine reductase
MYNGAMTTLNASELTRLIKTEAHRRGFDLVGITDASPLSHMDVYTRWLDQGHQGQMAYLATERAQQRRADLRQILPDCRSVVVVGINYLTEAVQARLADDEADFHLAAYAWGEDYHDSLPPRLEQLVEFIEEQFGGPISHKIYTDTGPILERELAQRAGLGWIGKNTCLINPIRGSYFILAEILLGIELEPDAPFEIDRCGSCTRCLEACPTACILSDRTLDARRCLSYLTIELKDDIPLELRELGGKWLFGCDICQQVCPWNARFSMPTDESSFKPAAWLDDASLADFLRLEPEKWRGGLRGSPLERPRRVGLVRNACVVAGNSGDEAWLELLTGILQADPEPLVRAHAVWALARIGGGDASQALEAAQISEADPGVRRAIKAELTALKS